MVLYLSWIYGIKPKFWFDTLSMARPFHHANVGGSLKALANHYNLGQKGDEVIQALGKNAKTSHHKNLTGMLTIVCKT